MHPTVKYILKVGKTYITDMEFRGISIGRNGSNPIVKSVKMEEDAQVFRKQAKNDYRDVSHLEEFLGLKVEFIQLREE